MDQLTMKKSLTAAFQYSCTRMALNYYIYFEGAAEEENRSPWEETFRRDFQRIMGAVLKGESSLGELEDLRRKAMDKMEVLTAYTDCFQVYEHVLNRLELRYVPSEEKQALPDDEALASEILRFLTSSRDSALMNERIQMVMEQLPIRFTKSKFFSLVQEGLSIYKGSEKSSLDAMMYVLRTESMIQLPDNMKEGYEDLYEILSMLSGADYKNLSQEEFNRLADGLQIASGQILDISGQLMLEMDLINDLYVMHLAGTHAVMDAAEKQNLTGLLQVIWTKLEAEDYSIPEDQVEDMLVQLEGKQERYYERWLRYDTSGNGETGENGSELSEALRKTGLLLSGSSFVELEQAAGDSAEVTENMLDEEIQKFFQELSRLWDGMPRVTVRAVMARILSSLPVCFNSVSELEAYVKSSLESCTDMDEKKISMELIRTIMVDENEMA